VFLFQFRFLQMQLHVFQHQQRSVPTRSSHSLQLGIVIGQYLLVLHLSGWLQLVVAVQQVQEKAIDGGVLAAAAVK
jgi:hypothetical protein